MSTLVVQNLSLGVGGLPNGSVTTDDLADGAVTTAKIAAGAVVTADLADAAVTAAKLDGAQSGSAPIYGARAWVNFNGTGTVAIRASGNVSSITDNGTGIYRVNFTTAMANTNYAAVGMAQRPSANTRGGLLDIDPSTAYTTTSVTVRGITVDTSPGPMDVGTANVVIFQ